MTIDDLILYNKTARYEFKKKSYFFLGCRRQKSHISRFQLEFLGLTGQVLLKVWKQNVTFL